MSQESILIVSENETYKTSLCKLETENRRFIFASYSTLINAAQQRQPDVIVLFISEHQETTHEYFVDYVESVPEFANLLRNPILANVPILYMLPHEMMGLSYKMGDSIGDYGKYDCLYYPFATYEFQARIEALINYRNQKHHP